MSKRNYEKKISIQFLRFFVRDFLINHFFLPWVGRFFDVIHVFWKSLIFAAIFDWKNLRRKRKLPSRNRPTAPTSTNHILSIWIIKNIQKNLNIQSKCENLNDWRIFTNQKFRYPNCFLKSLISRGHSRS